MDTLSLIALSVSYTHLITEIKNIMDMARKASSPVRFIWHNSSFYSGNGWKNWKKVFETTISEGNQ